MSGVPVSAFTEAVRLTGPTVFTGVRDVINDSQKTNYNTQGYLMRGQTMSDVVQGGIQIVDDIFLSATRKARTYRPGQKQSYSNPQTGTQLAVPWRMFITDVTWDDTERELNEGAGRAGDRSLRYKDIWFKKQMNSYSDWCDFIEEQYWLPGDPTRMEAANGDLMNSFPWLINEFANGLVPATNPSGVAATTKCGIDPSASGFTNWLALQTAYTNAGTGSNLTNGSLLTALKVAFQKLDFRPPPQYGQYFQAAQSRPVNWIGCTNAARAFIWMQYMQSQNRWDNQMDPYGNPVFDGAPFVYIAALDGALIYPTGSNAAIASATWGTEGNTANGATGANAGPRYYLMNSEYIRHIYHSKFTMANLGVMDDRAQPTAHTMPLLTWCNVFPRSLRRNGLVFPSGLTGTGTTSGGITGYPTN